MKKPLRILSTIFLITIIGFEFRQAVLEVDTELTIPSLGSFMQSQTIDSVAAAFVPLTVQKFSDATKWYVRDAIDPLSLLNQKNTTLVTFWSKDCVSCIRMIPTLNAWQKKYSKNGFMVVSIYEPSADESLESIREFIQQQYTEYRVAVDGEGLIRQLYGAEVWPVLYLFDSNLNQVDIEFGDRRMDELEETIRTLIGWTDLDENPIVIEDPNVVPGAGKKFRFDSPEIIIAESEGFYSFPVTIEPKHFALSGGWIISGEEVEATETDAALRFRFNGTGVRASLDYVDGQQHFPTVKIDGRYLTWEEAGKDVQVVSADGRSYITVSYYLTADIAKLVSGDHVLEIIADAPGLRVHFLGPVE